jgi:hypothetical protein
MRRPCSTAAAVLLGQPASYLRRRVLVRCSGAAVALGDLRRTRSAPRTRTPGCLSLFAGRGGRVPVSGLLLRMLDLNAEFGADGFDNLLQHPPAVLAHSTILRQSSWRADQQMILHLINILEAADAALSRAADLRSMTTELDEWHREGLSRTENDVLRRAGPPGEATCVAYVANARVRDLTVGASSN